MRLPIWPVATSKELILAFVEMGIDGWYHGAMIITWTDNVRRFTFTFGPDEEYYESGEKTLALIDGVWVRGDRY